MGNVLCITCSHLVPGINKDPLCAVRKGKPGKLNKDHDCEMFAVCSTPMYNVLKEIQKVEKEVLEKIEINDPAIVHVRAKIPTERKQSSRRKTTGVTKTRRKK